MITIEEYRKLFDEYCDIITNAVKAGKSFSGSREDNPRLGEIRLLLVEFEANNPVYTVICKKDYYVGQGTYWFPGDVYTTTVDLEHANYLLKKLNDDPWSGGDAWELKKDERSGK